MALMNNLLQELETEAQTTRRLLERIPEDRLTWRPHPKARTLGQLAMHVGTVPGSAAQRGAPPPPAQPPASGDPPHPQRAPEFAAALDESIACAKRVLG